MVIKLNDGVWHDVDGDGTVVCGQFFGDKAASLRVRTDDGKEYVIRDVTGYFPNVYAIMLEKRPSHGRMCKICKGTRRSF